MTYLFYNVKFVPLKPFHLSYLKPHSLTSGSHQFVLCMYKSVSVSICLLFFRFHIRDIMQSFVLFSLDLFTTFVISILSERRETCRGRKRISMALEIIALIIEWVLQGFFSLKSGVCCRLIVYDTFHSFLSYVIFGKLFRSLSCKFSQICFLKYDNYIHAAR